LFDWNTSPTTVTSLTPRHDGEYRSRLWGSTGSYRYRVRGKSREPALADDDLTAIGGRKDQLEGKIQERYGYGKDQVRKEIDSWYRSTALVANDNAEELAEQIEAIRADIQSLRSTVSRVANKQLGQVQDKAVEAMSNAPSWRDCL
jgi:uncharacterized protein YjbJ (UPF0337 family)